MSIEAVVFDIGRVLVGYDPYTPYDRVIGAERRNRLFAEVPLDAVNEAMDAGAPFPDAMLALQGDHPEWAEEIALWETLWPQMFAPEITLSSHLLRALKGRGVPVYGLSNFGRETFAIGEKMYPVLQEFDIRVISAIIHAVKPDAAIYETLEAQIPQAPETLLFTDDKPENIAAAEARGWQGHLFQHPEGLAERLVAEGLLSVDEASL